MNGPAALKISKGDKVIIIAYAGMEIKEAKKFKPQIILSTSSVSIAFDIVFIIFGQSYIYGKSGSPFLIHAP